MLANGQHGRRNVAHAHLVISVATLTIVADATRRWIRLVVHRPFLVEQVHEAGLRVILVVVRMHRLEDHRRKARPNNLVCPELDVGTVIAVDNSLVAARHLDVWSRGVKKVDVCYTELTDPKLSLNALLVP